MEFHLKGSVRWEEAAKAARSRVEVMNRLDGTDGFVPPLDIAIRDAMTALQAGFETEDWDAVMEAYCMLQDAEASTWLGSGLVREGVRWNFTR